MMGITDKLKGSSKGQLIYRKHGSPEQFKALLDKCSSPPEIAAFNRQVGKDSISPASSSSDILNDIKDESFYLSQSYKDSEEEKKDRSKDEILFEEATRNRKKMSCVVSPEYCRTSLKIKQYEKSIDEDAKIRMREKHREFEQHSNLLQKEAQRKLEVLDSRSYNNMVLQHEDAERQHSQESIEVEKRHRKLKEDHSQHALNLHAKIQKAEETKQKLQEEAKRREEERRERWKLVEKSYSDLKSLFEKVMKMYEECQYKLYVPDSARKSKEFMKQLLIDASKLLPNEEGQSFPSEGMNRMKSLCERATNAYEHVRESLETANVQGKEAEALEEQNRLNKEANAATLAAQQASNAVQETGSSVEGAVSSAALAPSEITAVSEGEVRCVDLLAFEEYTKYQSRLEQVEKMLEVIVSDPRMKKVKFNLSKAVNTPINAISAVSGRHLKERLMRLLTLVNGQTVEVSSNLTINASQYEQGTVFCKYLIAKMLVKKGSEQVSSIHESAFAIAAVATGLWCEHSDIGDLLLAQFHSKCPYTVPYYIPKAEGQTMEQYHTALGYEYTDGVVEKHDKFLKRMSGIMRLYSAILISIPLRGQTHPHPHGIERAWIWLTRILNIEPQPDITATMIFDLLDVAGHSLSNHYGMQFQKLLHIIVKDFLARLLAVASQGGRGPVYRLQEFLQESIKNNGRMPPPKGLLPPNFWHS
ncbi:hypothetical protein ScPMuIL_013125 [Solemya velum]